MSNRLVYQIVYRLCIDYVLSTKGVRNVLLTLMSHRHHRHASMYPEKGICNTYQYLYYTKKKKM